MTDKPEHPQDQSNARDQSLEAQLDALLNDLEETEPDTVPADLRKISPASAKPQPAGAKPAEPAPAAPQPKPEPVSVSATEVSDKPTGQALDLESIASMASNMLDQQIEATIAAASQAKANDRAEQDHPPAPGPTEAAPAPIEAPAAEIKKKNSPLSEGELGDQIQALLNHVQSRADDAPGPAPEPAPATTRPAAQTAENEYGSTLDAGAVSIEQIDAMLAESAEQAIEREPEPDSKVPGTDEVLAAQALEEDARIRPAAQPAEPRAEHNEPQPAPQPVAAPATGASAADVAKELDEDDLPAPAPVSPAPPKTPAQQPKYDDTHEPATVVIHQSALKKAEQRLLQLCGKINRPLSRLSPEMRDTVGYVGIVVLLPALCLIFYGLVF